jgi:hypothetical protein
MLAAGVWALWQPAAALYLIGAIALTLLFVGIHNAWDLAVWMTAERPAVQAKQDSANPASGTADVDAPQPPKRG